MVLNHGIFRQNTRSRSARICTPCIYHVVAVTQHSDNGATPDFFYSFLFEKQLTPDPMFNIEPTAGHRDIHMEMLNELSAVGMQHAKNTDFYPLLCVL